jgi:hypothetical protein
LGSEADLFDQGKLEAAVDRLRAKIDATVSRMPEHGDFLASRKASIPVPA